MGDGGPITVPPDAEVMIGSDGSVAAKAANQPATPIGRSKRADPPAGALVKGGDGLLRQRGGEPAEADPAVRVVGIDRAVERKYGRPVAHLAAALGADGADGARVTIL